MFEDAPLTDRRYKSLLSFRDPSWEEAPSVSRATRCGRKYLIQVMSRSKEPWLVKEARLEGPNGVLLKVKGIRSGVRRRHAITIIVARCPRVRRPISS